MKGDAFDRQLAAAEIIVRSDVPTAITLRQFLELQENAWQPFVAKQGPAGEKPKTEIIHLKKKGRAIDITYEYVVPTKRTLKALKRERRDIDRALMRFSPRRMELADIRRANEGNRRRQARKQNRRRG